MTAGAPDAFGRIAILGAGAIGSALGALLRRAGRDVVLVGRADHVALIRARGLRVEGVRGSFTVAIDAEERLGQAPDIVFLTMKTQDVAAAVEADRGLLGAVPVVTFQNGVRSDEIVAGLLPEAALMSVVVNFHARFLTPGEVTILYDGSLMVGRPFAPNDHVVDALAALLALAFPARVTGNVRGAHWLKLIVNLNNALPALTRLTLREVYRDAGLRRLSVCAMREGIAVATRAGIVLEGLPDMPVAMARAMTLLPSPLAGRLAALKLARMESRWPLMGSTLQSLLRGEPTEIDYLNGEIVRVAARVGMSAPINAAIVRAVHEVEQTRRFLTPVEACAAIGEEAALPAA
jgi:2-dehydropantoate 2-reductase